MFLNFPLKPGAGLLGTYKFRISFFHFYLYFGSRFLVMELQRPKSHLNRGRNTDYFFFPSSHLLPQPCLSLPLCQHYIVKLGYTKSVYDTILLHTVFHIFLPSPAVLPMAQFYNIYNNCIHGSSRSPSIIRAQTFLTEYRALRAIQNRFIQEGREQEVGLVNHQGYLQEKKVK